MRPEDLRGPMSRPNEDDDAHSAADGSTLAHAALRGVLWLVLQSLGGRAVGVLSQIALAYILDPASFGLVGIVYALTSIAGALVNFGVDDVLLQREKGLRLWAAPAFWTSFGLSLVGFALTIAAAAIADAFYGAGAVLGLAACAGLMLPLGALQTIPTVVLRTRMDFRTISLLNMGETAAVQVATVGLALAGAGAYSFVAPGPVVAIVKLVFLWKRVRVDVFKRFRSSQLAYMLGSGAAVFATRIIIAAISQGDYLILGLVSNRVQVGLYYFAFKLAAQPLWVLAANFTGVLFPTLVKLKAQPERQLAAARITTRLLSFATMPMCCLQAALAGPALRLMFGDKWLGAIPVIQILSLGLAFDAVTWITGTLLSANREFRRALSYTALFAPLFFVLVLAGAREGAATGAAIGVAIFYAVMGPGMCFLVFRRYGLKARDVADVFVAPAALASASVGSVAWATSGLPDAAQVAALAFLSAPVYGMAMAICAPAALEELLRRVLPARARAALERHPVYVGMARLSARRRSP